MQPLLLAFGLLIIAGIVFLVWAIFFRSKVVYDFLDDQVVLRTQLLNQFSFGGFRVPYSTIKQVRKYDRQLDKWHNHNFGFSMNPDKWVVILRGVFLTPTITFGLDEPEVFLAEMKKRLPDKVTV